MSKRKIIKNDEEWKDLLSEEEFMVCREKRTEKAFTGKYTIVEKKGFMRVFVVDNLFLIQSINMIRGVVGLVFINRLVMELLMKGKMKV